MLALIGGLYEIERDAKQQKLNAEETAELRRCRAKPKELAVPLGLRRPGSDELLYGPFSPVRRSERYSPGAFCK